MTDTTDANGRRTTFSYSADGDQTGETWVGASPSEKITYVYDADRELTGAVDSFATLTFTYNNDGQLQTDATSGPGSGQPSALLSYTYDQIGDETSVTDNLSSQGFTTYVYDSGQRLTTITTSYGGTAGPQVLYTYDSANRLTGISRQVGASTTATQVNTTIVYDNANRVGTITDGSAVYNLFPPGWTTTPLATYTYSYDNANRATAETDAEGTASFTYDNSNELTGVTGSRTESYSYDLNGNRTGTGYSTTIMNEIRTSPGIITYTYDNAGNTVSANSGGTFTTYTYDYRNRLTGVKQGGTVIATYVYDALNRRISVQENGSTTWTIYDGTSPDAMPYVDFNGSGTLLTRYVSGPGVVNGAVVDELLARTSSGGTTAWYLTDKLDSVRDVVSSSGSVLDHIVYDSFGNTVTETSAGNGDRFKFAGMERDTTTQQYFDHARWYGPSAGRFTRLDPTGFASGDTNLFRYVGNDASDGTDFSGLADVTIIFDPKKFRTDQPSFGAVLENPFVQSLMSSAWLEHVHTKGKPEIGRWVLWNPRTGQIMVTTQGVSVDVGPGHYHIQFKLPNISDWVVLGHFHTHPSNVKPSGNPTFNEPPNDLDTANNLNVFGAVVHNNHYRVYGPGFSIGGLKPIKWPPIAAIFPGIF